MKTKSRFEEALYEELCKNSQVLQEEGKSLTECGNAEIMATLMLIVCKGMKLLRWMLVLIVGLVSVCLALLVRII